MTEERIRNNPISEQIRTEIGGLDVAQTEIGTLTTMIQEIGLVEFHKPIPGHHATVYFLSSGSALDLPFRFRYRIYGLNSQRLEVFQIAPNDVGVLEAKTKLQRHPLRVESKQREFCEADAVVELIQFPGTAREVLDSYRPILIPDGYPRGTIDRIALRELSESLTAEGWIFPSLVIASNRQHFIADLDNPDALRVTFDSERQYFGYNPHVPNSLFDLPVKIGGNTYTRVEIKSVGTQFTQEAYKIKALLGEIGIVPPVRKTGFQAYFRHFFGVPDRYGIQPIYQTNETEGREIEAKLNISSPHSIEEIARTIYKAIDTGAQPTRFQIEDTLRTIRESRTSSFRYGVESEDGSWNEVFVILERPELHRVGIKRKTPINKEGGIVESMEEAETLLDCPLWTQWAEEKTLIKEAERLRVKTEEIKLVGKLDRRKLKVYVEQVQTRRLYIISIDENTSGSGSFRQVEIEYGGRRGIHSKGLYLREEIVGEISDLRKIVVDYCQSCEISLEQTTQSKFDWLLSKR